MRAAHQRDTAPELAVRAELHRRGLRFYVDRRPIPSLRSRADILFPRQRVAVYIHGCFWHGCPEHGTWPKANAAWWRAKIERNQTRDRRIDSQLKAAGWTVVQAWAHEPPEMVADKVVAVVAPTVERRSSL
jgi:DNA mismatch endonuclease, patch repair protein